MSVTVEELIDTLKAFPKDSIVVLSSDAEGNRFSTFEQASNEYSQDPNAWSVELDDPYEDEEDNFNVVVLWP